MRVEKYPLTDGYNIIVFRGSPGVEYSISGSNLIYRGKYVQTDFGNQMSIFRNAQLLGGILETEDSKIDRLYSEALSEGSKEDLIRFLSDNGWEIDSLTYIICKKFNKKLAGKKIPIIFNIVSEEFNHDYKDVELDVYMSYINKNSKKVTFSVRIPDYIYKVCSEDPAEEKRPTKDYIEDECLGRLHSGLTSLSIQARSLVDREKSAKKVKKYIAINFTSNENTLRDSYQWAYVGQEIRTSFNWYTFYGTVRNERFTFYRVDSDTTLHTLGIKGVSDYTKFDKKNWISSAPRVYVEWTQEREDFLLSLEDNFRKLSENLNKFLKDLDTDKLDLLVANRELLKLKT
jgi:hypothetical protein